jgi:hypothetical protein
MYRFKQQPPDHVVALRGSVANRIFDGIERVSSIAGASGVNAINNPGGSAVGEQPLGMLFPVRLTSLVQSPLLMYHGRRGTYQSPADVGGIGFDFPAADNCIAFDAFGSLSAQNFPSGGLNQKVVWCATTGARWGGSDSPGFPLYVFWYAQPGTPLKVVSGRGTDGLYNIKVGYTVGGIAHFEADAPDGQLDNQFEAGFAPGSNVIPINAVVYGWFTGWNGTESGPLYATNFNVAVRYIRQNPTTGDLDFTTKYLPNPDDYVDADFQTFALATKCTTTSAAEFFSF